MSYLVPEGLPNLMGLVVIAAVEEIHTVEVGLVFTPLIDWKGFRFYGRNILPYFILRTFSWNVTVFGEGEVGEAMRRFQRHILDL